MFRRIFGVDRGQSAQVADQTEAALTAGGAASGDTATVRRIVARLEALPPERARFVASAAYTLARAAHADLEITTEETEVIERELQAHGAIDEATAVLVTEMAKLQARNVGGTEDYVVTREFTGLLRRRCRERLDLCRGIRRAQPDRQRAAAGPGGRQPGPGRVP
jgi:hypothetical protein